MSTEISEKFKRIDNFKKHKEVNGKGLKRGYYHRVYIATKTKEGQKKSKWYLKEEDSEKSILTEVLSQEFCRLICPRHPKTRLVKGRNRDRIAEGDNSIISKKIKKFISLNSKSLDANSVRNNINTHTYTGFGEILVLSLYTNEVDFHTGNIGVDSSGKLIKIDGGFSFASVCHQDALDAQINQPSRTYSLSDLDISALPMVSNYKTFNWLDVIIVGGPEVLHSEYFDIDFLQNDEVFLHEVHSTILKISLLPDDLFEVFVHSYFPKQENTLKIIEEMQNRRDQLLLAALKNEKFIEYLSSQQATEDVDEYKKSLPLFQTMKKTKLVNKQKNDLSEAIEDAFMQIQEVAKNRNINNLTDKVANQSQNTIETFQIQPYVRKVNILGSDTLITQEDSKQNDSNQNNKGYQEALNGLQEQLKNTRTNNNKKNEAYNEVKKACNAVGALIKQVNSARKRIIDTPQEEDDLKKLTKVLKQSVKLLKNPNYNNIDKYRKLATSLLQDRPYMMSNPAWRKKLGGTLLIVLGLILIVAAVLLAISTAGIGTPASTLMTKLGVTSMGAGIGIAVGAGVVSAGVGAVALGSHKIHQGRKGTGLANNMNTFANKSWQRINQETNDKIEDKQQKINNAKDTLTRPLLESSSSSEMN